MLRSDREKNHDPAGQRPDLIKRCAVLASVKTAARRFAMAFGQS